MSLESPLALIGYRGTGKTTVARLLAERCGVDWIDADVEVERRAGKSIAEIFAELGEAQFRQLEAEVVAELCGRPSGILALGGGAVLSEASRDHLAQCHGVVWLTASATTIAKRLAADTTTSDRRPNLTNHGGRTEIEQVLAKRTPIYRACATLQVDTEDKRPAEIADEIFAAVYGSG